MENNLVMQALTGEFFSAVPGAKNNQQMKIPASDFGTFLDAAAGMKPYAEIETRSKMEQGTDKLMELCASALYFCMPDACLNDISIQTEQGQSLGLMARRGKETTFSFATAAPVDQQTHEADLTPRTKAQDVGPPKFTSEKVDFTMQGKTLADVARPPQLSLSEALAMTVTTAATQGSLQVKAGKDTVADSRAYMEMQGKLSPLGLGLQDNTTNDCSIQLINTQHHKAVAAYVIETEKAEKTANDCSIQLINTQHHKAVAPYVIKTEKAGKTANGLPVQPDKRENQNKVAVADSVFASELNKVADLRGKESRGTLGSKFMALGQALADDITGGGGQPVEESTDFNSILANQQSIKSEVIKPSMHSSQSESIQPPDPHGVASQIVQHARLIARPENSEMIIKLKPEHLGELTLKVAVENGTITATFHSNNAEVRSVIESSLPQLRQELASSGLKVDYVGVYAGLSQQSYSQGQQGNWRRSEVKIQARKTDAELLQMIEKTPELYPAGQASGVDYRI